MSTDHRPSVDQLLTDTSVKYRPTIGEVSVNEKLYRPRHIWNDYRPCLDRVSTHYRPTIDRYIDRVSTAISTAISVNITHSKQDPPFLHCKGLRTAMYKCYINSIIVIIIWCETIWLPQESISMLERRSSCPFPRIMIQYHIQ